MSNAILTTFSQTAYNSRKKRAIDNQPLRLTLNLSEINILSPTKIAFRGNEAPLSHDALKNLASILKVPITFQENIGKIFGEDISVQAINKIKSAMQASSNFPVTLVASPESKKIVGVLKKPTDVISSGGFFEVVEKIVSDNNLEVRDFIVHDDGFLSLNAFNPKSQFGLTGLKDEVFNGGVTFYNSLDGGFKIAPYLNRLICSNGMEGTAFKEEMRLTKWEGQSLDEFYKKVSELSKRDFKPAEFEARVQKAMGIQASLSELESVHHLFTNCTNMEKNEIEIYAPLGSVKDAYRHSQQDPNQFSQDQRRNAPSNMNMWELINNMTFIGSRPEQFKSKEIQAREIRVQAGRLLAQTFDMENQIVSPFN